MQRMPETSCPNALSAPCSLCPPRETNFLRPFTTISASGATLMAALVTYASSTFTIVRQNGAQHGAGVGEHPLLDQQLIQAYLFRFLSHAAHYSERPRQPRKQTPRPTRNGEPRRRAAARQIEKRQEEMHGQRRSMPYRSKRQRTKARASAQKQTPAYKSKHQSNSLSILQANTLARPTLPTYRQNQTSLRIVVHFGLPRTEHAIVRNQQARKAPQTISERGGIGHFRRYFALFSPGPSLRSPERAKNRSFWPSLDGMDDYSQSAGPKTPSNHRWASGNWTFLTMVCNFESHTVFTRP